MINYDRIRKLRKYKEITLEEMAHACGFQNASSYKAIEDGKNRMKVEHLMKVAELLDVEITELLDIGTNHNAGRDPNY